LLERLIYTLLIKMHLKGEVTSSVCIQHNIINRNKLRDDTLWLSIDSRKREEIHLYYFSTKAISPAHFATLQDVILFEQENILQKRMRVFVLCPR
jgi:hypothetical protein